MKILIRKEQCINRLNHHHKNSQENSEHLTKLYDYYNHAEEMYPIMTTGNTFNFSPQNRESDNKKLC